MLTCTAASATEQPLSTAEISDLLTGKTIEGLHFESHTRQYFSASGLTLWIKQGDAAPSEARYKIEGGKYCSSWFGLWNTPEWGCFSILKDREQGLYYFHSENFRAPFIIGKGFDLSFD